MRALRPIYFAHDEQVLDLTYGRGKWWDGVDANVVEFTGDYRNAADIPDSSFDRVVFDPPYIPIGGRETSSLDEFNDRYGLVEVAGTVENLRADMLDGQAEAIRVCRPGGFIFQKCQQAVVGGTLVDWPLVMKVWADTRGVELWNEITHHSGLKAQPLRNPDGSFRVWQRAAVACSNLLVFKKPKKAKQ